MFYIKDQVSGKVVVEDKVYVAKLFDSLGDAIRFCRGIRHYVNTDYVVVNAGDYGDQAKIVWPAHRVN